MTELKTRKVTMLIIAIGVSAIFASVLVFSNVAEAQESKIPQWVKTTTTYWSKGEISDTEYVNAIEYLLKEKVMKVPSLIPAAEGQEMTKSLESLQNRVNDLEKMTAVASSKVIQDIPDPKIAELNQKINELSLTILKLDEDIKKEASARQLSDLAAIMSLKTYVKISSGPPGKVAVSCDTGDIATGGGGRAWGGGLDYTIPNTDTNYGNPSGWAIREYENPIKNMEVYVVCLDITP